MLYFNIILYRIYINYPLDECLYINRAVKKREFCYQTDNSSTGEVIAAQV